MIFINIINIAIFTQMKEQVDYDKNKTDKERAYFKFNIDEPKYKTIIENYEIDFTRNETIRDIFGFDKIRLGKGRHLSSVRNQITHIKRINIQMDLINGGYNNQGKISDIILSYPTGEFSPGDILRRNVTLYFPVIKEVVDQN